jgi:hypothetical protein
VAEHVLLQCFPGFKGFSTFGAKVAFFLLSVTFAMNFAVFGALYCCPKCHWAQLALKGFLARVGPLVFLQQMRMGKSLVTIGAGMWLFPGVSSHVCVQFGQQRKPLRAFLAMERHVAGVNFHMLPQGSPPRKGLVAFLTRVRVLFCVNFHMRF